MTAPDPHLTTQLRELLSRRPVLLALDFDGVLAPIVDEPSEARLLPGTAELLAALADSAGVHVALVSGRSLDSLRAAAQLGPDSRLLLVGSHGAEVDDSEVEEAELGQTGTLDDAGRELLDVLRAGFDAIAADHPGVHVETKPAGVVLHTRPAARDQAVAATDAALAFAKRPGSFVTQGKQVVEVSVVDTGKGVALDRLRDRLDAKGVLYVGDDVTDENAFAVLRPGDIGVKVGDGDTLATHRLPDPAAVQALLREARAHLA